MQSSWSAEARPSCAEAPAILPLRLARHVTKIAAARGHARPLYCGDLRIARSSVIMPSDPRVTRLSKLSPSVVSDVLDRCGYPEQSLSSTLRPLATAMCCAGRAVCFAGIVESEDDATPALPTYAMDEALAAGTIAVIATDEYASAAVVGGLMALSFAKRGCAGIVTDGAVRDVAEITALGLPAFCAAATPLNSAGRWKLTQCGGTITLPGHLRERVEVRTGDYVVGDADGVMVIPEAIVDPVLEWAETLAAIEVRIVAGLQRGEPREKVFASNPRFGHIGKLR
jgi:regulator of RNase E activity RraA